MRYYSIDILRTLAIFVMVFVHFGENLSGYISPFAGFGAPLFAFLSGVSYRLWVSGQETRGVSDQEISKISIRRGLFVVGVGFAFNIFVWLPEDTFNWDVLTFIGSALLLLNLVRTLPLPVLVLGAMSALVVSPILRTLADYDAYWINRYFECDLSLSEVLIGFLATGYFPIFPWIAYSLAGFVTGTKLFAEPLEPTTAATLLWPTIFTGSACVTISLVALFSRSGLPPVITRWLLGGWTMYPPTIEYVLGTFGLTLIMFGTTHFYVDRNPRFKAHRKFLDVTKFFSQYSFTVYLLHHVVHLWPLWIYGIAAGFEPTHFWMNAMPLSWSFLLAFLFMVCCFGILRILGPSRTYGIESWMRWLCD